MWIGIGGDCWGEGGDKRDFCLWVIIGWGVSVSGVLGDSLREVGEGRDLLGVYSLCFGLGMGWGLWEDREERGDGLMKSVMGMGGG